MVGNGDKLRCNTFCSNLPVTLGKTQFLIDFYVLPISRADVILGIQWLKTLGPIVTDCANLSMQFQSLGSVITLQGIRQNSVSEISSKQLK